MNFKEIIDKEKVKGNNKIQYFIVFLLFLILIIPNIFTMFYATDLADNFKMKLSYLFLSILIWLLPLLFLSVKNYFRLSLIFLLLAPLEIAFVKSTGLPINIGLMESILNTDFREAKEQIFTNLPFLIFYIIILLFYGFLLTYLAENHLGKRWKIGLVSVFLFINVILVFNMYSLLKTQPSKELRIKMTFENSLKKYRKIFPANIIINTISAVETNNRNKKLEKNIENFTFNAKQIAPNSDNEIFILVIGETARRNNFHLYGYNRETTPELEKIQNLIPFTNVDTAGNLTLLSLPQIITRADPEQFDLQFKEKTILDLFQEAHFYTAWIGSQNISTPIVQRLKDVCDFSFFQKSDVSSANFYDGDILKNLETIIADKSHKKKFIIIHTLGSHFRYSNRYPYNFEKFKPNISKSGYSNISLEFKNELVNSYDNSILYTDFFLASVIKEVQKTNAASSLIYLSDHGENLYDDNKTIFHGSEKPTKFEVEIPYLVWYSQKYKDLYPEKVAALENNKNKKASSTATFYTLSDLANINYKNSTTEISKSLSSSKYNEPKKRKMINSKKEVVILDN